MLFVWKYWSTIELTKEVLLLKKEVNIASTEAESSLELTAVKAWLIAVSTMAAGFCTRNRKINQNRKTVAVISGRSYFNHYKNK